MSKTALEVFNHSNKKKLSLNKQQIISLRARAIEAVTEMMRAGEQVVELPLEANDLHVLSEFGQELHDLSYKYCLIERVNDSGEILDHRLRISVTHLGNQ